MKWGITVANVSDFSKPPEKLSYPQQFGMLRACVAAALAAAGVSARVRRCSRVSLRAAALVAAACATALAHAC
jgi:hypothetical protein